MAEKKNGIILEYSDKILQKKFFIFNGKQGGEYISYWDNGQLEKISNYKNDKKEGEYKLYWVYGQLEITCNYKNNIGEEEYKCYYENG